MKSNHQIRNSFFFAVLLLAITGIISCNEKETAAPQEDPPAIPPLSTFMIDLSDFDTSKAPLLSKNFNKPGGWYSRRNRHLSGE